MHRNKIRELLKNYCPATDEEAVDLAQIRDFVEREPRCFERDCPEGHLTGSCWLENWDGSAALLTHHKKLNMWLQLGGHADGDSDLLRVALREAQEESSLPGIVPVDGEVFDVGVHLIPARGDCPAHYHYDVRFWLKASIPAEFVVSDESNALRWLPRDASPDQLPPNVDVQRMFQKWNSFHFIRPVSKVS